MKTLFVQKTTALQFFFFQNFQNCFFFLENSDFLLKENHLTCVSKELMGMLGSRRKGIETNTENAELQLNHSAFSLKSHISLLCSTRLRTYCKILLCIPQFCLFGYAHHSSKEAKDNIFRGRNQTQKAVQGI